MSDEYDEPTKHRASPLYIAGSIIGTILALSALRFTFDIDVVGGIINIISFIPDRVSEDKNVIEEAFSYLSDLFNNRYD